MKRIMKFISFAALCFMLAFGSFACNTPCAEHIDVDPEDGVCDVCGEEIADIHTHSFDTDKWTSDDNAHWRACNGCNEKDALAEHLDEDNNGKCDVCERELPTTPPEHKHDFSKEWTSDENAHWRACNGCNEKDALDEHIDKDNNGKCDVCERELPTTPPEHKHDFSKEWTSDDNAHWHACNGCNEKDALDEHIDKDNNEKCDVCEKELPHIHKYNNEVWESDDNTHWHPATCGHSEERGDEAAHIDSDGNEVCDICEKELPHIHKYNSEVWESDENTHWHPATCGHSEERGDEAAHSDRDDLGICDVCGTAVPQRVLTVSDCLMPILTGLLTKPLVLDINTAFGQASLNGCVYIDAHIMGGAALAAESDALSLIKQLLNRLEIRANFGEAELWYYNHIIYLSIGETKISLSVSELIDMLSADDGGEGDTGGDEGDTGEETEGEDLLSLLMNATVTRDKENGTACFDWEIDINGYKLPVNFLFDVVRRNISLNSISLGLDLLGTAVSAALSYAETNTAPDVLSAEERAKFTDITSLITDIPKLTSAEAYALNGSLDVLVGDKDFGLNLKNISFDRNFRNINVDLSLEINGSLHDITLILALNEEKGIDNLVISYGDFGIRLDEAGLEEIKAAFMKIIERITTHFGQNHTAPTEPQMPVEPEVGGEDGKVGLTALDFDAAAMGDLMSGLDGVIEFVRGLPDIMDTIKNIDIGALLSGLFDGVFSFDACRHGGFIRLSVGGSFAVELRLPISEKGYIGVYIDYNDENADVTAALDLSIITLADYPAPPEVRYFDKDDVLDLIRFADVAMDVVESDNLNIDFATSITSSEDKYLDTDGVKMNVVGSLDYYCDAPIPVTLQNDELGRSLVVNSDLYLNLTLSLAATHEFDTSLYLDIKVIDLDKTGQQDGILDFYVTVSRYDSESDNYSPLNFYVTSGDLMKILSQVVALLGVDNDFLNEFIILRWLDETSVADLKALGDFVKPLILSLIPGINTEEILGIIESVRGLIDGLIGGNTDPAPEKGIALMGAENRKSFIASMERIVNDVVENEETTGQTVKYVVTLTSGEKITLMRTKTRDYSAVGFMLDNIKGGIKDLSIIFDSQPVTKLESITVKYYFDGIPDLISSLAASVTHSDGSTKVFNDYFYFDGLVNASLLGLVNIDLNFSVSLKIDENGKLSVDAHLSYQGQYISIFIMEGCVIGGDTAVDISIRDGLIYIRRVQTSDCSSSKEVQLDQPITLYRIMPLRAFTEDTVNQIAFILNFGEFITQYLPSDSGNESGGDTEEPPTEPETPVEPETPAEPALDYGAILAQYLKGYTYTFAEGGNNWRINLDGNLLTNGILGAINLRINASEDGKLRSVEILQGTAINIPGVGLSVSLKGQINFRNSGYIMDDEVEDITVDVRDSLNDEVTGAIADMVETDWGTLSFLEYKECEVEYVLVKADGDEKSLSKQKIFLTTGGDGREADLLYSALVYPNIDEYSDGVEFNTDWEQKDPGIGKKFNYNGKIIARQSKCTYTTVFIAAEKISDDWQETSDGKYSYEVELSYGTTVTFMANGETIGDVKTITDDSETRTITLPEKPPYNEPQDITPRWIVQFAKDAVVFTVFYGPDTVNYNSSIKFTYNNTEYNEYSEQFDSGLYTLITPTAQGYIFLGWFKQSDGGWEQITTITKTGGVTTIEVEALWIADFSITTSVSGIFSKTSKAEASIDATALYGIPADNFTSPSIKYAFVLDNNETCSSYGTPTDSNSASEKGSKKYAHLQVTLTYTVADGSEITFVIEKTAKF